MLLSSPRIQGVVKQFPYRAARVDKRFLTLPRDEVMSVLEHKLAEAAGARVDNHTVYEIVQDDEKPPVYIMFSDFTVTFAHDLRKGSW